MDKLFTSAAGPAAHTCYELGVCAQIVKPVKSGDFIEAAKKFGGFWALLNQLRPATASRPG